ncbi:hypothetical protein KBI52_24770 [Microvirga sp. HBU67558]|uniref:calcium-binding protein n=1 Tax=Microvirga TaxID=186650 RepID=UPI001B388C94|nr:MULTISPECIES: calcium-binding protein [unclassified Microvirga]MBQ0823405.1 hypothetical protein [Microvirga sp. HBU67558]
MAVVTFHNSTRPGLRLKDFFTPITSEISIATAPGWETARFQVNVDHMMIDVLYGGPVVSDAWGQIAYIEFKLNGVPYLTYGEWGGSPLFAYRGLSSFQEQSSASVDAIMTGADQLNGSSNADYLEGSGGDDRLYGGPGADTLNGGSGNDTYFVDSRDDRILEAPAGGHDIVSTTVSFAMAADAEIEELWAAEGVNSLSLIGNDFANLIVGTPGDDEIDGKGGADVLIGQNGNDLYIVDSLWDVVREETGQGYDTIITQVSFTLSDNVEVLKAAGGFSPVDLVGNEHSNEIFGNIGANIIRGLDGDDRLYGDGGDDILDGGTGQDFLYGGIGNDLLSGEDGTDVLYGDMGKDTIDGGAGHDRLYGGTESNWLIGQSGDDTLYGGVHADTLQGGEGFDRLYGDTGNDSLDGGFGNDTLAGGWGRDTFVFRNALNARANFDTITDFNVKDDTIRLENGVFKKLRKTGKLHSDYLIIGGKSQDANDYLVYNRKNGYLSYDADGAGSKYKPVLFFKLKPGLAITEKDFFII